MKGIIARFSNKQILLIILSVIVGVCAGLGAVGVRQLIRFITTLSFSGYENFLEVLHTIPTYRKILAPAIGGLIVGPIIYFFAKEAKGHGVPEVMLAMLMKDGKIRPRVAFVKAIASAISIGSGGSVGREGPIVQIGASLGSTVGQYFNLDRRDIQTLVACGAAGGIAAAFNAPIAGALFSVEIILGDFGVAALSPIIISSVISTIVARHFEGNLVAFVVPPYSLNTPFELLPYTFLGIVAGLIAVSFIVTLYYLEDWFEKSPIPEYVQPMIGGFIVGLIGVYFPYIYGVGYESINGALHNQWPLYILLLMIPMKIIATSITLGSGGSGGVFAPSLFLGAATGGAVGVITHSLFPQAASAGAYALVGMGAVVAATTQAPITAIIIIFELTQNYMVIAPLMFTCIISTLIATAIKKESIYTLKLKLKGIELVEGREESILKQVKIDSVIKEGVFFYINHNLKYIIDTVLSTNQSVFPVLSPSNKLVGILTLNNIKSVFYEKEALAELVIAEDIAEDPVYLTEDSNLQDAMDIEGRHSIEEIPVVKDSESMEYRGIVFVHDIINLYNFEIKKRELALAVITRKKYKDVTKGLNLGEGMRLMELKVPDSFVNRSLKDLAIRNNYNLEVLIIKRGKNTFIPNAETVLHEGDNFVVVGKYEDIRKLRQKEGV
ncbi:chloride channel protein, CIC family [Thermotomaculum hydrothermale]|uniref:Chloride channel protein, CIC family n=1 Tax=Thermotomaculum hydrothermale TaxID=981385 RepID=A0A7R6SZ37_9BACT|nr:chloride channel protein [Thermotomaculum hydrothermale]BBB33340.1 chloride channel protein, CIC family [Thermotomaculum hydrothermale]